MEYRILGKSNLKVSALAFGCNQIGSSSYGYKDDRKAMESIHRAIDSGINFFDTADVYGERKSESLLGEALIGGRGDVIISTKAGLTGDGGRDGRPEHLKLKLEESLTKLKTDYVDVFFLHSPDPMVPIEDSIGAIDGLVKEGKVRFAGVTHASTEQLEKIASFKSFAVVQDRLNIFDIEPTEGVIPFCIKHNIGFSAHSPLASGLLSGKYFSIPIKSPAFFDSRFWNPEFPYLDKLENIAKGIDISLPQLALAWALRHEGISSVIMGTSSLSQLTHNIESLRIKLDTHCLNEIDILRSMRLKNQSSIRKIVWKAAHYGVFAKVLSMRKQNKGAYVAR